MTHWVIIAIIVFLFASTYNRGLLLNFDKIKQVKNMFPVNGCSISGSLNRQQRCEMVEVDTNMLYSVA